MKCVFLEITVFNRSCGSLWGPFTKQDEIDTFLAKVNDSFEKMALNKSKLVLKVIDEVPKSIQLCPPCTFGGFSAQFQDK